jgi:hypothetical protein
VTAPRSMAGHPCTYARVASLARTDGEAQAMIEG